MGWDGRFPVVKVAREGIRRWSQERLGLQCYPSMRKVLVQIPAPTHTQTHGQQIQSLEQTEERKSLRSGSRFELRV